MRRINKQNPLPDFATFVSKNNPTKWEEIGDLKYDMRVYMLCYEQDCLCGYSEIPIEPEKTKSHIDHFVKQEYDSKKIFDWNNLIVSTIDEDFGGKYKDNTYKIKTEEYQQIFNPVVDDMSQFIEYSGNGEIVPLKKLSKNVIDKVKKTIEVFNLNCPSLNNRRRDLILQLDCCKDIPQDEIKKAFGNRGFVSVLNWFLKVS